jgi:hypothetical protein
LYVDAVAGNGGGINTTPGGGAMLTDPAVNGLDFFTKKTKGASGIETRGENHGRIAVVIV